MSTPRHYFIIPAVVVLVFATIVSFGSRVSAGPLTGSAGRAPFTKLGVYGGLLVIAPGGKSCDYRSVQAESACIADYNCNPRSPYTTAACVADSIMEIGNNGRDLASTGDIFVRPSAVRAELGVIFNKTGVVGSEYVRMYVPGKVCLHPGGGAADCRNQWPVGSGSGGNYWMTVQAGNYLSPNNLAWGAQVGSAITAVTDSPALNVTNGGGSYQAWLINKNLGYAAHFSGNVYVNGPVYGYQKIKINDSEVWHPGSYSLSVPSNEGLGTGMDADLLDGKNVTVEGPSHCDVYIPWGVHAGCLCIDFPGLGKKCADLSNRF